MKKYGLIVFIAVIAIIILCSGNLSNKNNINENINYEIVSNISNIEGTKSKKNRGYEIVEKDNEYFLIIYYGEQPNYYNNLDVSNVEIKGENVKVTVKLPENDGFGDAFSYPKAIIKFDKEPKKINIVYK